MCVHSIAPIHVCIPVPLATAAPVLRDILSLRRIDALHE
jgi:hypothetical protein